MESCCKMVPPNSWNIELEGRRSFHYFYPPKAICLKPLGQSAIFQYSRAGWEVLFRQGIKRSWLSKSKKLWSTGRSQPWGRSITSQLHWLPVAANSGTIWQPDHRREEGTPGGRKNSYEAPEVEVQPEKLQPAWDCSASSSCHSAEHGLRHPSGFTILISLLWWAQHVP